MSGILRATKATGDMRQKAPRCSVRRCKRRPVKVGLCNTHLLREADAAFSQFIRRRDRSCWRCGSRDGLQCMHIISRRYRALRWDERNAVAGCLKCHTYFTHRPLEWEAWIDSKLGAGTWAQLRKEALAGVMDWRELAAEWIGGDNATD